MGLGKTLSMIALIASDHRPNYAALSPRENEATRTPSSTLVILPVSSKTIFKRSCCSVLIDLTVISVWTSQLERYAITLPPESHFYLRVVAMSTKGN